MINRVGHRVRALWRELRRPGESQIKGADLWAGSALVLRWVIVITNLVGAGAVLVIGLLVVPVPVVPHAAHVRTLDAALAALYVLVAVIAGRSVATARLRRQLQWLVEDRPPTSTEVRAILRAPIWLFALQACLWGFAALLFGLVDATYSGRLGLRVGLVVFLTGLVTGACAYLLAELLMRPIAARALANGVPDRLVVPGVATRSVLGWVLGTGMQLVGIVAIGTMALSRDRSLTHPGADPLRQLGTAMVVLGGTGIAVGLLVVVVVAKTTADPIDSVRRGLGAVQRGRMEVRVPVYDGTQIGQLQLGFNEMAAGLEERERIRTAFGTYVDPDVARRILEEGIAPGGEDVEVTSMFVDVRDFTGFSERTPPGEIVAALNELFEQCVVPITRHGGRVDKFIGDGLLAVFGAPRRLEDHADQALLAAVEIATTVHSSAGLQFGIGINSGRVIAGNIGGAGRLEFSVIGDPVNVASRVESATRITGDTILITERTRDLLGPGHPPLVERDSLKLRGKSEDVRLFAAVLDGAPVSPSAPAPAR